MRNRISILLLLLYIAGFALTEEVKLTATADIWLSDCSWEGTDERLTSMGKAPRFKLKSIQEMAVIRFDASGIRGREVKSAKLFMKVESDKDMLRFVRVSTVNQDWKEGNTVEDYGKPSGACYNFADYRTSGYLLN
jgi:hypothetical protein